VNKAFVDKWNNIYAESEIADAEPCDVLLDNLCLLPQAGKALDLASGLGANAQLLAKQGLTVQAWDISPVALHKLQCLANAEAMAIKTYTQEVTADSFSENFFDVVVVGRFLDRSICNAIMESLKPNGLLFYQTYTQHKVYEQGPKNPRFLLAEHELLQLFSELNIIYYRENKGLGNIKQGLRNEAQLIGQKL